MAMIAVAVLVGVWPAATSLAPSCSRMKSNDLLDSSRGGLNSWTLAPRSPKSCKVSTSSLMAIYSFACSGGWQSWTAPTEVVLQTIHKTVANKCPVHHVRMSVTPMTLLLKHNTSDLLRAARPLWKTQHEIFQGGVYFQSTDRIKHIQSVGLSKLNSLKIMCRLTKLFESWGLAQV